MNRDELIDDINLLRAQLKYVRKAEAAANSYDNQVWLKDFGDELSRRISNLLLDLIALDKPQA